MPATAFWSLSPTVYILPWCVCGGMNCCLFQKRPRKAQYKTLTVYSCNVCEVVSGENSGSVVGKLWTRSHLNFQKVVFLQNTFLSIVPLPCGFLGYYLLFTNMDRRKTSLFGPTPASCTYNRKKNWPFTVLLQRRCDIYGRFNNLLILIFCTFRHICIESPQSKQPCYFVFHCQYTIEIFFVIFETDKTWSMINIII